MSPQLTWTDADDPRVAVARSRAYYATDADRKRLAGRTDYRAGAGDVVLALDGDQPIATATSLSCEIIVRGRRLPGQGVAWVGTDKTHRRTGEKGAGVATQVMHALLDRARERGVVVSALMPFRVSFYEHFGYGVAERRAKWTVPTGILPRGDFAGMRYATDADLPAMADCRRREAEAGHVDCDFGLPGVREWHETTSEVGFAFVDDRGDGTIASYAHLGVEGRHAPSLAFLPVQHFADDEAFLRQLHWLASLRDQHDHVGMHLPIDVPLDQILREKQLPHRPVIHPTATCQVYTRMQCRILDHVTFCQNTPAATKDETIIRIHEPEGHASTIRLTADGQHLSAELTDASPAVELDAPTWATLALGEIPARTLHRLGRLTADDAAVNLLDTFAAGRAPFCNDYF